MWWFIGASVSRYGREQSQRGRPKLWLLQHAAQQQYPLPQLLFRWPIFQRPNFFRPWIGESGLCISINSKSKWKSGYSNVLNLSFHHLHPPMHLMLHCKLFFLILFFLFCLLNLAYHLHAFGFPPIFGACTSLTISWFQGNNKLLQTGPCR